MAYTGPLSGVQNSAGWLSTIMKPDIDEMLHVLKPYMVPIQQWILFSEGRKQSPVYDSRGYHTWFEDEYFPYSTTLSSNITGGGTTGTINVASGTGAYFVNGNIIQVDETDQAFYITNIVSDALSVTLIPAATATTITATTGSIATNVIILDNQNNEYNATPTALYTNPIAKTQYLNIWTESVAQTGRDQAGEQWTNGLTFDAQTAKKVEELRLKIERYMAFANLTPGMTTVNSYSWTYGNGLLGQITSNVTPYSKGALTATQWDTYLKLLALYGTDQKYHFCGVGQMGDIVNLLSNILKYEVTDHDTTYGVKIKKWETPYGYDLNLVLDKVFTGKYSYYGVTLDDENVELLYMNADRKGSRVFRIEENVQTPGTDGEQNKILCDMAIKVVNQETCGWLKGA